MQWEPSLAPNQSEVLDYHGELNGNGFKSSQTINLYTWWYLVALNSMIVCIFLLFTGNARKNQEGIVSNSVVYFTNHVPVNTVVGGPEPLKLKRILDMVGTALRYLYANRFVNKCTQHINNLYTFQLKLNWMNKTEKFTKVC